MIKKRNGLNLLLLQREARALGASDAAVIQAKEIPIEDAIVELCRPPACQSYGTSANCPPFVMSPGDARTWIAEFDSGLFFKVDVPPETLFTKEHDRPFRKIFQIASRLAQRATERGWTNTGRLGAGSCKSLFCPEKPCAALGNTGTCCFPDLARPSMEAIGINVFTLARIVGWRIHQILRTTDPHTIPTAMIAGMVLLRA